MCAHGIQAPQGRCGVNDGRALTRATGHKLLHESSDAFAQAV